MGKAKSFTEPRDYRGVFLYNKALMRCIRAFIFVQWSDYEGGDINSTLLVADYASLATNLPSLHT